MLCEVGMAPLADLNWVNLLDARMPFTPTVFTWSVPHNCTDAFLPGLVYTQLIYTTNSGPVGGVLFASVISGNLNCYLLKWNHFGPPHMKQTVLGELALYIIFTMFHWYLMWCCILHSLWWVISLSSIFTEPPCDVVLFCRRSGSWSWFSSWCLWGPVIPRGRNCN